MRLAASAGLLVALTSGPSAASSRDGLQVGFRAGVTLHATRLPGVMSLCDPLRRGCSDYDTVSTRVWRGQTAWIPSFEVGADLLALGPLRAGFQLSLGLGPNEVPALRVVDRTVQPSVFYRGSGELVLGLRGGRGRWRLFADFLPGFATIYTPTGILHAGRESRLASQGFSVGGRAGAGYHFSRWAAVNVFAGGSMGAAPGLHAGLAFEISAAPYD
ncbi:MAG: hypothetical protein HOO96_32550 [Polyangiaceae bacterium]|nr:hypothetical protein [Polyangiaceae bacterium]